MSFVKVHFYFACLKFLLAFLFLLQKSFWCLKAELNNTFSCNICSSGAALSLTCATVLLSNLRLGAFCGNNAPPQLGINSCTWSYSICTVIQASGCSSRFLACFMPPAEVGEFLLVSVLSGSFERTSRPIPWHHVLGAFFLICLYLVHRFYPYII